MKQNNDTILTLKNICYEVNQVKILKNISLKIRKGEFVGLIGPNGAGKTTLLKCINGINKANGVIEIKDKNIQSISTKEIALETALMHQNAEISFPFASVDIVLMGRYPHLKRMQSETKEDFRIARENMDYTDTLKFEQKPITQVSGGEKQRILFAKVLTQQTDILLLDEPTASLDIIHQEQIFKYSCELSNLGKTVIAAVHDLKVAAHYCSRLVLMKDGEIISDGLPEEVLTPDNLYSAYGVNALVYKNTMTGMMDFYISDCKRNENKGRVHVIGGGGSASTVIRYLFEKGYKLSTGVLNHGDSDLKCAEVFGIDYVTSEPFCDINEMSFDANIKMIENADITVLCNIPFGKQNLKNLQAAKHAKKLVIIQDDTLQTRDFSGGKALEIYDALKENAIITTSAGLYEVI